MLGSSRFVHAAAPRRQHPPGSRVTAILRYWLGSTHRPGADSANGREVERQPIIGSRSMGGHNGGGGDITQTLERVSFYDIFYDTHGGKRRKIVSICRKRLKLLQLYQWIDV